jgi:hypothetical protein
MKSPAAGARALRKWKIEPDKDTIVFTGDGSTC